MPRGTVERRRFSPPSGRFLLFRIRLVCALPYTGERQLGVPLISCRHAVPNPPSSRVPAIDMRCGNSDGQSRCRGDGVADYNAPGACLSVAAAAVAAASRHAAPPPPPPRLVPRRAWQAKVAALAGEGGGGQQGAGLPPRGATACGGPVAAAG